MSTVAQMIARTEDRWPDASEVPDDALGQVLLASHLLGADRAVANFGGGNTSAKGTATDHVGREVGVMWVKGSGSDLATMERKHFTPLRLDEMLPLIERDEMPDEDMVAHLARCQTDPAAPRASIETLLHAFVPADARPPHAPGRDQRAGRHARRRARWSPSASATRRRGSPTSAPASRSPSRSATAVRENPDLKLVVLAKHGLVVWGDSAEEAYRRTIEVINQAVDFVNARTEGRAALRRSGPAGLTRARRELLLHAVLPALRGAVSSERRKVLVVDTSPRVAGVRLLARRAGAGDGRRGVPGPPRAHQARCRCGSRSTLRARTPTRCARACASARRRSATSTALRRAAPRRGHRARRPRRARGADPARRAGRRRADDEERAAVARPLPPGDRGDGGRARAGRVRLARRRRELRRSSTGRSSSTSSRWRRRPASCRARSRSSPARAGGIGRAVVDDARRRPARASWASTSTPTGAAEAVAG